MKELFRFEVAYESKIASGATLVIAENWEEASQKFKEDWERHGDTAPNYWCRGQWSVQAD